MLISAVYEEEGEEKPLSKNISNIEKHENMRAYNENGNYFHVNNKKGKIFLTAHIIFRILCSDIDFFLFI